MKYAATILICLYMVGTIHRNYVWHSSKTLWADAASKSPNSARAWLNLAREYHLSGNKQQAFELYQKSMYVAANQPDFYNRDILASAQSNLGNLLISTGQKQDRDLGITALQASLDLIPWFGPSVVGLSKALNDAGRYPESITLVDGALSHGFGAGFKGIGTLYFNKAVALCASGLNQIADENFTKASKLDPDIQPAECR